MNRYRDSLRKVFVGAALLLLSSVLNGQGSGAVSVPFPASFQMCAVDNCLTYTLEDGDYKNYTNLPNQNNEVRTLEVKSFTRDSIIFRETDTGSYPLTAVWWGHIVQGESSVAEGTFQITSWAGTPTDNPENFHSSIKWGAAFPEGHAAEVCLSPAVRVAMQDIIDQEVRGPASILLGGLACGITGVCGDAEHPEKMQPTIVKSRPGNDMGGFTANDPGSFLCQGMFARGNVHLEVGKDGDLQSELTKEAMAKLLGHVSGFQENFKVRPLQSGRYLLILIPGLTGLPSYSAEFKFLR